MNRGFSLVELSIVLVILGLLTGGVLTGQSLIRAAELRSVTTEFQQYQTAVNTFKSKYFALPGDMLNATSFWDEMSSGTCPNATGTGTETCDGNGNGRIDWDSGDDNAEPFLFWQHLVNAKLVSGKYTGDWDGGFSSDNSARGPIGSTYWYIIDHGIVTISRTDHFDGSHGHALHLFSDSSPYLSPTESWNIDTKMDDGKPASGRVLGKEGDGASCHVAPSSTLSLKNTATYNLDNDSLACYEVLFTQVW